jgi:hypothetical protein
MVVSQNSKSVYFCDFFDGSRISYNSGFIFETRSDYPAAYLVVRKFVRKKAKVTENREKTMQTGGGRGIRTLDTVSRIHAFQACAFSHSATPPDRARGATPAL